MPQSMLRLPRAPGRVSAGRSPRTPEPVGSVDRIGLAYTAGLTLVSLAVGYWILTLCLPALGGEAEAILARHLAPDTPAALAWLKLLGARLPILLLLSLAALTRISGGITTAVLVWRGLSDGAALALAIACIGGTVPFPHPVLGAVGFAVALGMWILTDATLRVVVSVSARRVAALCASIGDVASADGATRAALRYRLWRHGAITAAAGCGSLLFTLIYIGILH